MALGRVGLRRCELRVEPRFVFGFDFDFAMDMDVDLDHKKQTAGDGYNTDTPPLRLAPSRVRVLALLVLGRGEARSGTHSRPLKAVLHPSAPSLYSHSRSPSRSPSCAALFASPTPGDSPPRPEMLQVDGPASCGALPIIVPDLPFPPSCLRGFLLPASFRAHLSAPPGADHGCMTSRSSRQ
ncbi:hypothetical protein GSI_11626 [Ganoderma sinense ZZ0214-1]|uniref:Uncharacterized protein n=1 Tax=Ganoderma sinense ZZ0214-1 TaxID=1077348 RepID=A0A2G8RWI4_9APHY|nr:hypothetical protein GSI_11626 [Ganoderma sinense ZZ0214-1]